MGYFPFFIEIKGADCLVVGGGMVAYRKIEKLLPFGVNITVVSPCFHENILTLPHITKIKRPFEKEDIKGRLFVIGATNDEGVNGEIAALCKEAQIPVNIVDDREKCTFFFPALVKRGEFVAGFTTGGNSPLAAKYMRRKLEEEIPPHFGQTVAFLGDLREECQWRIPYPMQREAFWEALFARCLESRDLPKKEEIENIFGRFEEKHGE